MERKLEEYYKRKLNEKNNEVHELKKELEASYSEHERLIEQYHSGLEEARKEIRQESEARKRAVEMVKKLKQEVDELRFRERNINGRIRQICQGNYVFAIAELEKLKEVANRNYIIHGWIPKEVIEMEINQQINELKASE